MILNWTIRYLDRSDKQFKSRYLYLDTKMLDPVRQAAVEFVAESNSICSNREILKYRQLFVEGTPPISSHAPYWLDTHRIFCLIDYFEDETGKGMPLDEMARILTGSPTARIIPPGARQHDIDLMLAAPIPIRLAQVSLSTEQIRNFGYFVRDLEELRNSVFMQNGPGGSLKIVGNTLTIRTAVTDDEIRSFVTIFRRLYMEGEPANFKKAVDEFVIALGDHPLSKWVEGTAKEYEARLAATPDVKPFVSAGTCSFSTKRLIDVFIYTQYAHQPDAKRQRQFEKCLAELQGKRAILTWLFLMEIWRLAAEVENAGNRISSWFKQYCDHHGISPDVLDSLLKHHPGLGTAEKDKDRRERVFREKAEQLAAALWEKAGSPQGGPMQFLSIAQEQLAQAI